MAAVDLLLSDDSLTEHHRELAASALKAGQYLLALVAEVIVFKPDIVRRLRYNQQVLDMGRIEQGRLDLAEKPFYSSKVVDDIQLLNLTRRESPILINNETTYTGEIIGDSLRLVQMYADTSRGLLSQANYE